MDATKAAVPSGALQSPGGNRLQSKNALSPTEHPPHSKPSLPILRSAGCRKVGEASGAWARRGVCLRAGGGNTGSGVGQSNNIPSNLARPHSHQPAAHPSLFDFCCNECPRAASSHLASIPRTVLPLLRILRPNVYTGPA